MNNTVLKIKTANDAALAVRSIIDALPEDDKHEYADIMLNEILRLQPKLMPVFFSYRDGMNEVHHCRCTVEHASNEMSRLLELEEKVKKVSVESLK